ncbi:MAG TPA: RnfABCDGE type electron transport complex subunit A [Spirochaetota bacterium]|nr:RnfABCDGE type electron transport complex subunit A [Spirochaetota bacterium]HPC41096.1 RnfABCDGE type electron transport complex subunit A [Spirochaetota bacterium]HPL16968.1 RnfABCDGE type electron transport complex subunit A [Spirochaetota bacterium]HQF08791.1 RnfABCDGE type electron transport complex subunit A [Spirochaetota bacterium]HQH97410.1 RnfABCDGE type electron transport complex subunit A [Spirochaetota bacterium]
MEIKVFVTILLSTIFINNYVLARILGLCPFLGVSRKLGSAVGMGLAVIFVMTLTSFITYPIYKYVLVPYRVTYLTTIVFILVIAALVQLVEMVIEKTSPALYQALGIFLPLITTNCAVLGVAVLNLSSGFAEPNVSMGLLKSVTQGFGGGAGFTLALVIMAGIRERLELADIPENLKGVPITFITAGLLALAFYGFSGMKI